jgi:hypothetical protein
MQHNPNPELIDEENPEWTEAMFRESKTAAQLLKNHREMKTTQVNKIKEFAGVLNMSSPYKMIFCNDLCGLHSQFIRGEM